MQGTCEIINISFELKSEFRDKLTSYYLEKHLPEAFWENVVNLMYPTFGETSLAEPGISHNLDFTGFKVTISRLQANSSHFSDFS